ncbi:GNAT family N-acetyltransferase [Hoeflea sp.]|uniref:GNAT family N-acetyltransferase n=1 Tax=Hoeflea sp. TaxID=1940281 RepID=UPI003B51EB80
MKDLKRAVAADRERVEEFQHAAYARTEAVIDGPAIPLAWDYGEIMRECEVWLDERDGILAGVLILRPREQDLFLESIATNPAKSGLGIGAALMQATLDRARSLGLEAIALITNSRNPAAKWYRNVGFTVDFEEVQENRKVLHMSLKMKGTPGDTKGDDDDGTA